MAAPRPARRARSSTRSASSQRPSWKSAAAVIVVTHTPESRARPACSSHSAAASDSRSAASPSRSQATLFHALATASSSPASSPISRPRRRLSSAAAYWPRVPCTTPSVAMASASMPGTPARRATRMASRAVLAASSQAPAPMSPRARPASTRARAGVCGRAGTSRTASRNAGSMVPPVTLVATDPSCSWRSPARTGSTAGSTSADRRADVLEGLVERP